MRSNEVSDQDSSLSDTSEVDEVDPECIANIFTHGGPFVAYSHSGIPQGTKVLLRGLKDEANCNNLQWKKIGVSPNKATGRYKVEVLVVRETRYIYITPKLIT